MSIKEDRCINFKILDDKVIEEQVQIVSGDGTFSNEYHLDLFCCPKENKDKKESRYRVLRVNLAIFDEYDDEGEIEGFCEKCKKVYSIDKETVKKIKEKYNLD